MAGSDELFKIPTELSAFVVEPALICPKLIA